MSADETTALTAAARRFAELVASLPADAWERETVCEVSVRELVEHVVAGNEFAVRVLSGASAEESRRAVDEVRLGPDPVADVVDSGAAQAASFASADPDRLLHHPSGDLDHRTFVRFRLAELVIHGWDVAVAAGLDTTMEPQSVRVLWDLVSAADGRLGPPGAYAAPSTDTEPLPPDATFQDRLLAAFGRRAPDRR